MRIAHLALTASLTFTAPAYAQPVELPKGLVGFTELVMQVVLQTAVSAARSQVELTYDDIVLDLAAGRTAMTGLEIHPPYPGTSPAIASPARTPLNSSPRRIWISAWAV